MSDNTETNATVSEEVSTGTEVDSPDTESPLAYENKKYRIRAQEAEEENTQLKKKLASAEEVKMIQEGKKDELIAKYQSDNEQLNATAQKWNKYEENRRNTLLESAPEEERERLAGLDLDTLEYVTNKINNIKANAPEVAGNPRGKTPIKPFSEMNETEKRAWHKDVLNNINN